VARAAPAGREGAEAREAVVAEVPLAGEGRGARGEEEVAVFGDEEEEEAVDEAEELAVVVLRGEGARGEALAESPVGGLLEEAAAEDLEGLLDAVAEGVEGAVQASRTEASGFSASTRETWRRSQRRVKSE
jgi:hypothetical protein